MNFGLEAVMSSTLQQRYKSAAIALIVVALGIDCTMKSVASYSALHSGSPDARSLACITTIGSACGLLIAGFAIIMWLVSLRRNERGSQLPIILLFGVYCLFFIIQV